MGEARYFSLGLAAHQGRVIAMACAQSKPMLISVGEDLCVRVRRPRSTDSSMPTKHTTYTACPTIGNDLISLP